MAMRSRSVWAICFLLSAVSSAIAQERITVLVAKKKIAALTFIQKADEFFEVQERFIDDVPRNALHDLTDKDLRGGFRVSGTIPEGSFLTRDYLVSGDKTLLAKLPQGMRAVAIKAKPDSLGTGFVLPGSTVDVIWIFRTKPDDARSLTILQNVLVLAIDTQSDRKQDKTPVGSTWTLAVKPEDAEKLALAAETGEITVSLRSHGDVEKIDLKGAKIEDLGKPVLEPKEVDKVPPLPPALPKEKQGFAATIPPGMRAVAIRTDPADPAAGFILPGSRVDLVGVERVDAEKSVAKTVLENVLVLAVDVHKTRDEKPELTHMTITVAVTPADALKLVQATEKGQVRALLRRPDDKK